MYNVYLSPSTQDKSFGIGDFGTEEFRMNQIADVIEKVLLSTGDYLIFRNKEGMNKDEIITESNNLVIDIHVAIHSNYGNKKGVECYVKVGDERSNGFGKEVYKELMKVYHDKSIDNGLIYEEKIKEIMNVKSSSILIQVGYHDNIEDAKWIINNIDRIGTAIAKGIMKGFTLKPC